MSSSLWTRRAMSDNHASPIEMRFIDLFMAALGALLFMAMLLAFLMGKVPVKPLGALPKNPIKQENLKILTRILPAAETGKPYEMAIAYRGGNGPVSWDLVAGQHEIPTGIVFHKDTGILQGITSKEGISRFVIQVRDKDAFQVQAYELNIIRGKTENKDIEKWLAAILLFLLLLFLVLTLISFNGTKDIITAMNNAYQSGQSAYAMSLGQGIVEHITLPEGITTYQKQLIFIKKIGVYLGIVTLALSLWYIWLLWSH